VRVKLKLLTSILIGALSVTACRKAPAANAQTATSPAATSGQAAAPSGPPVPAAPPKPVPAQLPDVVARVNGEEVKKLEFERMIHTLEQRAGQQIPAERRDEILRGALDQLVVYTLLSQESRNRGIKVEDSEIDQKVEQLRSKFPTQEAFTKALAERGMTMDRLKHDARVDISVTKLMDAEMATEPAPSEQDAKAFYLKNPDRFKQGEKVRASHILIKVDQKAPPVAKQKARAAIDAVLKQAKTGGDFSKLAQEHSQDGSSAQGGDLNYFTREQMVPEFSKVAFSLKPGEISDVVETQFGYHIIKVVDHQEARTIPFEEVNAQIKQFLGNQKKQQHADAFIDGLKKKSKIEVLI
jgi:peptidyl-prolyl cis-trans isomerase C